MKRWSILCTIFTLSVSAFAHPCPDAYNRYLERAKKKIAEEKYADALIVLEKAKMRQPENAEIFYLMGDCNKKTRNFSESIKNYAYARALANRKDNILVEGALKLAKLF